MRIGAWSDIGTNAVILPGVTVGRGSIVGAGAVVIPGARIGKSARVDALVRVVNDVSAGTRISVTPSIIVGRP